jgi:hypothetical protein
MILEMFAVLAITALLSIVGGLGGYAAFRYGQRSQTEPARLVATKRGLIITNYDPASRYIFFYGDMMTVNRFRVYGRLLADGADHVTGDKHWCLAVSRFVSFNEVLEEINNLAMAATPHGLDIGRPARFTLIQHQNI